MWGKYISSSFTSSKAITMCCKNEKTSWAHKQRDGGNDHQSSGRCSLHHLHAKHAGRGGNTAARPTHSAAAVISRDTGFLMDSSVFVCALVWCVSIGATRGWWAGRCCANITLFPAGNNHTAALSLSLCFHFLLVARCWSEGWIYGRGYFFFYRSVNECASIHG